MAVRYRLHLTVQCSEYFINYKINSVTDWVFREGLCTRVAVGVENVLSVDNLLYAKIEYSWMQYDVHNFLVWNILSVPVNSLIINLYLK